MASDSVIVATAVLFGPMDDLLSSQETGEVVGRDAAIEQAVIDMRTLLQEALPEGAVCKVFTYKADSAEQGSIEHPLGF